MLENMDYEQFKKLAGIKPKKPKKGGHVAEKKVLKACLYWLYVYNILHRRQNTGAFEAKDRYGKPRWIQYGEVGSGDIVGCIKGKYFEIECKATGGKQTEAQIKHQQKVEAAGGTYIVAYSTDDLHKLLSFGHLDFKA